ncbi:MULTISPECIES: hypothetical protein [Paraburkholderia]|nr:hypothetical protein [Paraburkholderia ferrariae]
MTRDEILIAVDAAFGASAWAVVGSWSIMIETVPQRQLIIADTLVKKLTDGEVDATEFEGILHEAQGGRWTPSKDGSLAYLLK